MQVHAKQSSEPVRRRLWKTPQLLSWGRALKHVITPVQRAAGLPVGRRPAPWPGGPPARPPPTPASAPPAHASNTTSIPGPLVHLPDHLRHQLLPLLFMHQTPLPIPVRPLWSLPSSRCQLSVSEQNPRLLCPALQMNHISRSTKKRQAPAVFLDFAGAMTIHKTVILKNLENSSNGRTVVSKKCFQMLPLLPSYNQDYQ